MAELPADVQAALDAYLAARVDDAMWEAYINRLGPGMALDVATNLCAHRKRDGAAAEFIGWCVLGDPTEDDPEDREPWGLDAATSGLNTAIGLLECDGTVDLALEHTPSAQNWYRATAWTGSRTSARCI